METLIYSESRAVAEKKVLLCLLAMREAERLGIRITSDDVQKTSDDFRVSFDLEDSDATAEWMKRAGLDDASYTRFMHYMTAVKLVQESLGPDIEALLELYTKVESVRHREQ